ncbi:MAG: hypothetical protein ABIR30_14030 [Chitinophagaceae bacterium]
MVRRFSTVIALFFLLGISFRVKAQKVDAALNMIATQFQPEKVFIHYDKEYYVAGETIWFKAYFFSDGKPSGISHNFYVLLTDSKGQIMTSKKYPVTGAVSKGNIELPDSLPQGNYYIRALTPDMMNYDESFIYKKNIFVFKPSSGSTSTSGIASPNISLRFFPESGNLVDGILSVVGFKAVDQSGMPAELNGIIRTEDGTTIASFKTHHDGIGKVQFKPQAGKKYQAEVETAAGKRIYPLPEVVANGINLKVQDEKGGKKFQLSRSEKDKKNFETLKVIAVINNQLVYEQEISFEDYPSVVGHIGTDSLPSGILYFTVFDKNGAPLAERLCFVDNGEYRGTADIVLVKTSTEKRAENSIELNFPENMQRSCSVAVIDFPESGAEDRENIYSRFLLSSDLKGYIYNPAWYFENRNDTTKLALDNLLLTHGWSRFSWTKILSGAMLVKTFKDVDLISIRGRVMDENDKLPLSNGMVGFYVEAEDSTTQNLEANVNADGVFVMDSVAFVGKSKLFYAYTDKQGKTRQARVHLDDNELEKNIHLIPAGMTQTLIAKTAVAIQGKDDINKRYRYTQTKLDDVKELEKVVVEAKSGKKPIDAVNEKYTTGVFRTMGKVNLDNINDPVNDKSMNVVDYIKNRIQQIEIQGERFVNRKNMSLMTGQKWVVGLFLNEVPTDMIQLKILRADDISLVKFYEAGFVGVGSGSPGGALAVYTKEKFVENKPDKLEYVQYNGYSITKEFYSPDYKGADAKRSTADNRSTLYWNPNVYTDMETKSVKLNFYNNDYSKRLKIVIEGFDAAGKLIHQEKIIGN